MDAEEDSVEVDRRKEEALEEDNFSDAPQVVVVGGGVAGLSCALELRRMGARVALVEARSELGGRCRSQAIGDEGCAVDMGAGWIHGIRKNPLYEVAAEAGLHCYDTGSEVALRRNGHLLNGTAADALAERRFNAALATARKEGESIARKEAGLSSNSLLSAPQPFGRSLSLGEAVEGALRKYERDDDVTALIAWHKANLEYANATNLNELSLRHWDQDDSYAFDGSHCVLREGMAAIAHALAEQFGMAFCHTNFKVKQISWNEETTSTKASPLKTRKRKKGHKAEKEHNSNAFIRIEAEDGRIVEADACVCTLPLGILKDPDAMRFHPELPAWKRAAIDRLGFGLLDKLAIQFASANSEVPTLLRATGALATGRVISVDEHQNPSRFFLFLNLDSILDVPVVLALTPADAAEQLRIPRQDTSKNPRPAEPGLLRSCLIALLRLLAASDGAIDRAESQVAQAWVTSWRDDDLARGSYAYLRRGSSPRDVDALATPLGGHRLRFAGEATIKTHLATASGAMLSGQREARRLARALGLIPIPGSREFQNELEESSSPCRRRATSYRLLAQMVPELLYTTEENPSKESDTMPSNENQRKARLKKRCTLCSRSDMVSTASVDEPGLGTFVAGDLLPFKKNEKGKDDVWWIHEGCLAATPDVVEIDDDFYKIESAVKRGRRLACAQCGKLGATLGCSHNDCTKSFHIKCAAIAAQWDFAIGRPVKSQPNESNARRDAWSDSDDDSDDDQIPFTCLDHRHASSRPSLRLVSHTPYRLPPPRRPPGVSRSLLAQIPPSSVLTAFPPPFEKNTGFRSNEKEISPMLRKNIDVVPMFRSAPVHELFQRGASHHHNYRRGPLLPSARREGTY